MGTDELLELIFQWSQERWPRRPAVSVVVKLADGSKAEFPLPDVPHKPAAAVPNRQPAGASAGAEKVYPNEMRVLNAVAGMEKENPTAAEIAVAAGMTEYTGFRALLLAMRRNGRLGGKAGADAYPITTKGQAAIDY